MRPLVALPALCLLAVALAPLAAADSTLPPPPACDSLTVGVGVIVVAVVSVGTQCGVAVQPYTCDVDWFGGRGLLGGFVFTCSPGLRDPCVFPVC